MSDLLKDAIALHQRGDIAEAARRYGQVLKRSPNNVDALFYAGLAHFQQGHFADAISTLSKVVALAPRHPASHHLLGQALGAMGRNEEAVASFNQALTLRPDLAEAYAYRGNALAALGRDADAVASYDKALAAHGDVAALHVNRGNSLRKLERIEEALTSYDRALALQNDFAEAHISRGLALAELSRCTEAIESYDRALALAPSPANDALTAVVLSHRAWAANHVGRFDEAFSSLQRALTLAPDHDGIRFQASFIELLHGRWHEAWPHHESRSRYGSGLPAEFSARSWPRWNGEPLSGELLMLVTEQGLGDAIHFSLFAAELAARGMRVAIFTLPVLAPLLAGVRGVERVVTSFAELGTHENVRWLPLMSVPGVLGTQPDTVPRVAPHLSVDPARVEAWRGRLGPDGFKIGIAWQGSYKNINDRNRSIALAKWAPLAALPGVRLISLQRGDGSEQIATAEFRDRIETPLDPKDLGAEAMLDTAALTMNLDLVVTIDSMLAHMAGALGRPVFVALRHVPEWRWLMGRDDSPWYPTMRLVRQTTEGVWDDVFRRIAETIGAMQAQRSP